MPERPVATVDFMFHAERLPDNTIGVLPARRRREAPERDTFSLRTRAAHCDVATIIFCSIGQLEHLQASIDALLQERSRELGPPAAIETMVNDEDGTEF